MKLPKNKNIKKSFFFCSNPLTSHVVLLLPYFILYMYMGVWRAVGASI